MKIWTGIITEKLSESKAFYTRYFACNVLFESDWFVLLEKDGSELGFMLPNLEMQDPIFRQAMQTPGMWITVDVDDVDAEFQRIKSLGASIELDIRDEDWGDRHFAIIDPNGIAVDVVQHMGQG